MILKRKTSKDVIIRVALLFSFLTLVIGALGIVSYRNFSKTLTVNIRGCLKERTIDDAALISQVISVMKTSIEGIASRADIQSMDWQIQKPVLLEEAKRLEVIGFQVANLDGFTWSTRQGVMNMTDRDHFKMALRGATTITDPIISRIDGKTIIVIATPIKKEGQTAGVLTAALDPQFLFDVVKNIKVSKSGYAFVLNKSGMIIAHPRTEFILSQNHTMEALEQVSELKELAAFERNMAKGKVGCGFYSVDGVKKFGSYAPIPDTNWSLAIIAPSDEIFEELGTLKLTFVLLMVISLIAVISVNIFVFRYVYEHRKAAALEKDVHESTRLLRENAETDKMRTDFFANLSHELRTPLNVILGAIQLLHLYLHNEENAEVQNISKHIKTIRQNCQRLLRLVNNLIDATKIDAGFFEIRMQNCNIVSVVEEIALSVTEYARGKELELQFDTNIEERIIACDPDAIERIILNLLSNAIKFTNPGGIIYITVLDNIDEILISVRDTGIGIPKDKHEMIFQRFRQVDESLTRNHEGSGIGLSLVSSLVEMHGGEISVYSDLGKGSEFIVKLPITILPEQESMNYPNADKNHTEKVNVEFSDIYHS